MRVVHLNTSDFGGAAMAAIQLHLALLDKGVRSDLLTLNKTRNDIPRHIQVEPFSLNGNPIAARLRYKSDRLLEKIGLVEDRSNTPQNRYLKDRPAGFEIFSLPYSFFSIVDHPLVQQADIVHLHWVGYGMIDYRDFFGRCSKKIVWTMHDMNPFTGGCHHADDSRGYLGACEVCPQMRNASKPHAYWKYKQRALAKVPLDRLQLVAPSQWLADRAEASSIMKGRSCTVVPNGFDTALFRYADKAAARQRLGLPMDQRVILFNALDVANPRKGMQLLEPALRGMHLKDVMLVCVGGGAPAFPDGPLVRGTGYLSSTEEIASYYSAADLFVLPSLAENLPNTISEALLCGTPVVAFSTGGIPEQIDRMNGILAERKTVEDLRSAIERALSMTWDHKGIAARAATRYDRASIAATYQAIYAR